MEVEGKIKSKHSKLVQNGDLAELIGLSLGDGHVCIYARTEELRITLNAKSTRLIQRTADLIYSVFNKKAYIVPSTRSNAVKVGLYQREICKRLAIPSGARGELEIRVPGWILKQKDYIVRYLRGLYEAEGSFCVHAPTSTYKFLFSNKNNSMILNVFNLMTKLGFHPHISSHQVQISKKAEVYAAMELLEFRKY